MIVCRTIPQLVNALKPASKTVAKIAMNKKVEGGLHQGHLDTILRAKGLADKTLINFWSWVPIFRDMYSDLMPDEDEWNEQYCLDFAETAGVDVVFIVDTIMHRALDSIDFSAIKDSADSIIAANNYYLMRKRDNDLFRMRLGFEDYYNHNRFYKKSVHVDTWKDGYGCICLSHYINKYTNYVSDIAAPTLRPDGIPYSSALIGARPEFLNFVIECNNTLTANSAVAETFTWKDYMHRSGWLPTEIEDYIPDEFLHLFEYNIPFYIKVYEDAEILGGGKRFIEMLVQGYVKPGITDQPIRLTVLE